MSDVFNVTELNKAAMDTMGIFASKNDQDSFSKIQEIQEELQDKNPIIKEYSDSDNFIQQFKPKVQKTKSSKKQSGWGSEKLG